MPLDRPCLKYTQQYRQRSSKDVVCYLCKNKVKANKSLFFIAIDPPDRFDESGLNIHKKEFKELIYCEDCFKEIAGKEYIDEIKNNGKDIW